MSLSSTTYSNKIVIRKLKENKQKNQVKNIRESESHVSSKACLFQINYQLKRLKSQEARDLRPLLALLLQQGILWEISGD